MFLSGSDVTVARACGDGCRDVTMPMPDGTVAAAEKGERGLEQRKIAEDASRVRIARGRLL